MNLASLRRRTRLPRVWLSVAIELLGVLIFAREALAQGAGPSSMNLREQERAALYREGLALAESGNWQEALRKFEAVVEIRSAPRALIALATAEEKVGRWVRAKRTYERVLPDAQASGEGELARQATAAVAALEPRIPRVLIHPPPGLVGTTVTVDGAFAPVRPEGIEIDPGVHRIVVGSPERVPFEQTFRVLEGEKRDVFVQFASPEGVKPPPQAALAPGADSAAPAMRGPPLPVWILGGAGVVATAIGLVVRADGRSNYDGASGSCVANRCPPGDAASRGNAAREQMLVGTIAAVAGGVAIGAAGIWWGASASGAAGASRSEGPSVRLKPSASGGSVLLRVAF
jgi:hypothetical protein